MTGASGLIGSALVKELTKEGFSNILAPPRRAVDLSNQRETRNFFSETRIDYVFHCAARVGGILANSTEQYHFLFDNLRINLNVMGWAKHYGVKKLLFMGSSCIYPRLAGINKPIAEDQLLSGPLEPSNEGYAIAKIAGIKLCQFANEKSGTRFITAMLTNAYGPHDNFDLKRAHIIPALMHRFHLAKKAKSRQVEIWGTGSPVREFLHSEDVARALILLMEKYESSEIINVGSGYGMSVSTLAENMRRVIGLKADIVHDLSKPEGNPRKILDIQKIQALGWEPQVDFIEGLTSTYQWAVANNAI